jgi:multisubunit Na+/H+ antiporter MnhF subunit
MTLEERRSWTYLMVAVVAYAAYLAAYLAVILTRAASTRLVDVDYVPAMLWSIAIAIAIVEADHFYIANAVYVCFVLSAVVGSVARVVVYRRGL